MKTRMMMGFLALISWGAFAQHDHAGHDQNQPNTAVFKEAKLGIAYDRYVSVKDALVASKPDVVKKGAAELQNALKETKTSGTAVELAGKMSDTADIVEQRKLFSLLSNEMVALVKAEKLSTGVLYVEYCPMANRNEGAYWLSNEKEIRNPYFGDKMLKCGTVKETIR